MLITFPPPRLANRNHYFGLKHLDARVHDEAIETKLEEPERKTNQPALTGLLVRASVADGVENSRHDPASTKNAGSHGELQTGNEKRSNEAGLILEVVAVRTTLAYMLQRTSSTW